MVDCAFDMCQSLLSPRKFAFPCPCHTMVTCWDVGCIMCCAHAVQSLPVLGSANASDVIFVNGGYQPVIPMEVKYSAGQRCQTVHYSTANRELEGSVWGFWECLATAGDGCIWLSCGRSPSRE